TPGVKDKTRQRMIDALLASNALWSPLRYPAEYPDGQTINQFRHYHYPSADDMAQILGLNNFRDFGGGSIYNASFGFIDQNPHNTMHIWSGGQNPDFGQPADESGRAAPPAPPQSPRAPQAAPPGPPPTPGGPRPPRTEAAPLLRLDPAAERIANSFPSQRRNFAVQVAGRDFHRHKDLYSQPDAGDMVSNLTASYDPIFWPIHTNIDRIWWEWQARNPNAAPLDLDAVLTPWSYTIRDMLDVSRLGYEYVRSAFVMPVGLAAPIGRFVSEPVAIDAKIKAFHKAEVRLHWVPQLARSYFVRAFLNQPDADAATPVAGNPHFAGYIAIFGHGACYGGPPPFDPPPPPPRANHPRPPPP